jgi:hypothetical protein
MTTTYTSNRTLTLNPVVVRRSGIPLLALLFFAGLLQHVRLTTRLRQGH